MTSEHSTSEEKNRQDRAQWLKSVRSIAMIVIGNTLYALTVVLFMKQSGIVTGGVTGISLALGSVTGRPISGFAMILNIAFWILGWILIGKKFALTTLLSTLVYPAALAVFERVIGDAVLTQDIWLNVVFAGLGTGLSLGLVLREGSSTGGVDVISLAANKYFKCSVSVTMYVVDVIILAAQILVYPVENLLYGIVNILIYTIVMDKVLVRGTSRTEIKVISRRHNEIRDAVMKQADRGVTLLHAEGGYLHEQTNVVLILISNRELAKIEKLIHNIDPAALIVVTKASEVSGRGFTLGKEYL